MDLRATMDGLKWTDVWPGLLILLAVVLLSLGTFFGDTLRRATAEGPRVTVLAPEVAGLERGSEVWLAGVPSGRVLGIRFLEPGDSSLERVAVETVLLREAMTYLRGDARVTIGSAALLAPSVIKIGPGSERGPAVAGGDTLRAVAGMDIEDFKAMSDSVRGAVTRTMEDLSSLHERIRSGHGSAARFAADSTPVARLSSARAGLDRIGRAWRDGGGVPRLLREDSLRAVIGRSAKAISELRAAGALSPVLDSIRAVGPALDGLFTRARAIADGVDRGDGTVGRVAADRALPLAVDRTRASLDSLVAELGANPLAWLRIRLF